MFIEDPNDTPDPTNDPADARNLAAELAAAMGGDDDFDEEEPVEDAPGDDVEIGVEAPAADEEPVEPVTPADTSVEPPKDAAPDVDAEIQSLGLKERSAARFRELTSEVKTAKDQVAELTPYRERCEQWERVVQSTGAAPEDFGAAMEVLKFTSSGTREDAVKALAMIDEVRSRLATRHGLEVAGLDPLADFEDLQQQVAQGDITRAAAAEVARYRKRDALVAQDNAARTQHDEAQVAIRSGAQAVDTLCEQLKASDPLYAQKFALVKPLIQPMGQTLPPAQWAAAFKNLYDNVQLPAAANAVVPERDTRRVETPQPIRRTTGGGGQAVPTTMVDALKQSIGI